MRERQRERESTQELGSEKSEKEKQTPNDQGSQGKVFYPRTLGYDLSHDT